MKDPTEERNAPMRVFDIEVTYTLFKKDTVVTNDYELECDDEGKLYEDTQSTDWYSAYKEDHYTVLELLDILKNRAKDELKKLPANSQRACELKRIIRDCKGWKLNESHYEEG